jgi:hypothetical protein
MFGITDACSRTPLKVRIKTMAIFACSFGLAKYSHPFTDVSIDMMAMPETHSAISDHDTTRFK